MKKVMTIVGTRPEVIKLSRVLAELDKNEPLSTPKAIDSVDDE